MRRHGAGQDAAVHRRGGGLAPRARRRQAARAALARRLPAHAHRYRTTLCILPCVRTTA